MESLAVIPGHARKRMNPESITPALRSWDSVLAAMGRAPE